MGRLQIVVDRDVETKVRELASSQGISVSAAGAKLLAEAVRGKASGGKDPWFGRTAYPSRQPARKRVSGRDHDKLLYRRKGSE